MKDFVEKYFYTRRKKNINARCPEWKKNDSH